jgi:hypothetical protein
LKSAFSSRKVHKSESSEGLLKMAWSIPAAHSWGCASDRSEKSSRPQRVIALDEASRAPRPRLGSLCRLGVTADIMDNGLGVQPAPTMYLPYLQQNTPTARVTLLVRTASDSDRYARDLERAVWSVDAAQPLADLQTLSTILTGSTGDQRFRTVLISLFARHLARVNPVSALRNET